ncbi:MAG: ornithine cyclodeaminase [Gammaproteobacteria bacterium]|nr:ornithine cyclodeaminase [Gammaproteobacteria bacterium]MBQ0840282.1 ornithine cyclodeaminase [Gammaproteobacteria bacterium]
MKLLSLEGLRNLLDTLGQEVFYRAVLEALERDFKRWGDFIKTPRLATHYPFGVIELMPCADRQFYTCKYVNGHPGNTAQGKLCVVAIGILADVDSGYPLLISEMTLLTAIRTAAVTALAAQHLARRDSRHLAIIGTGAQSEFQVTMVQRVRDLQSVSYFDPDPRAMDKFARNLAFSGLALLPCRSIQEAVADADMVITATAAKQANDLLQLDWLKSGVHIHAMGGDCPGKTELGLALLRASKIVVEYRPQSLAEGEVQNLDETAVHAELWQLLTGELAGRENATEITLFDAVGFALEDFSMIKLLYDFSQQSAYQHFFDDIAMLPEMADPKDLYGCFMPGRKAH